MTREQALARLQAQGFVHFHSISSTAEMNAYRDLTKAGLARFARFDRTTCGYVLCGDSFLDDVR